MVNFPFQQVLTADIPMFKLIKGWLAWNLEQGVWATSCEATTLSPFLYIFH
jgi:hypothetical protein